MKVTEATLTRLINIAKNSRLKDFTVGDRVVFVNNPYDYVVGSANPLLGTDWACIGTIISINDTAIEVHWDCGPCNIYRESCLAPFHSVLSTLSFDQDEGWDA
jgi:hypothetical protein